MTHDQRVAIARILSDLIKSDKIIEKSEILLYNKLQQKFSITQKDCIDAQDITLSQAITIVRDLDTRDKQELQNALLQTANADNQCVAKEALILLTLKYIIEDLDDKYEVLSCATNESYIDDKFMVIIDGADGFKLNIADLESLTDKLNLWNIEFVYVPLIAHKLKSMDPTFVKAIIQYINPNFSDESIEKLYKRLILINTVKFTTDLLGGEMGMPSLKNVETSLLINYATSTLPATTPDAKVQTYTEFLRIRLDNHTIDEVKQFIADYSQIITHRESVRPSMANDNFRYYGFYKVLFDFLAQSENGVLCDNKVIINPHQRTLLLEGREVVLSPMHITTYAMILYQSIKGYGLPRFTTKDRNNPDFHKQCDELTRTFKQIYHTFTTGEDLPTDWYFEKHIRNISTYVSHITKELNKAHLRDASRYLPYIQKSPDGRSYYTTSINIGDIFVKAEGCTEIPLTSYRLWK